jgi:hypothetical protein
MTLRTDPRITWRGKPAWNPSSWDWITTVDGKPVARGIERHGRLVSVRSFEDSNGHAAIEILVRIKNVVYSAVVRLDDVRIASDLFTLLDSLHGWSLKEIGDMQLPDGRE